MAGPMVMFTLALAVLAPQGLAVTVSPVQKVLTMMGQMKAKGDAMMQEEATTYATYAEWVDDQEKKFGFEIKTADDDIEQLLAAIGKADNDVSKLRSSITEVENEQATAEKEKSDAIALRTKQHAEYVELSTDYSESVDALKRAIQTMNSKNYDVPQAMALMQQMSASKPGMRRVLAAFIEETSSSETAKGGPAVAAYEFQSGGIVALLEKFQKRFEGELDEVESEESNQSHNHDLEMIHLDDTIAYMKKELEEKSIMKAKRAEDSAASQNDLALTRADRIEDIKTLKDMKATFAAKSDTFKANQEVRKQELEAISKAIDIIADPKVAGAHAAHIGLVQTAPTSFLQKRSEQSLVTARQRVTVFLAKKAQLLSSEALKELAAQAANSPFDKVVTMIRDLVAKLKEEAAAEAEHKTWCDGQLKSNKLKRQKKTSKVNKLEATVDSLTQNIASMGNRIATLSKQQAELQAAMSEATAQRQAEKATNTDAMKDAKAGEQAVQQALVVLREFYSSQSSFLQQAPEMAAYKGMSSSKGGVVGMLEVIVSDFSRLYSDTRAAETSAASEYNGFMKDAKASTKAKHNLEVKTSLKKDQAEFKKDNTIKDEDATQDELDKALAYQQHLKPVCLEVHVSYEERVGQRKEEIEALKEAYNVLDQK